MRLVKTASASEPPKAVNILSTKLAHSIMEEMVPLAQKVNSLPTYTNFVYTYRDAIDNIVADVSKGMPEVVHNKEAFMLEMNSAFDRIHG
jgi:hypothetical protein